MTVTYTFNVATSKFLTFHRLLFRWKGSVWKAVWMELLIWCVLYACLSIMYRLILVKHHKEIFENICIFFNEHSSFIPVTFMLGFYVSAVFNRWRQVFDNIGWIDQPSLQITQSIRGEDERSKMIRRNCIRYLVLMEALVFRDISTLVRRRFPTMNHLVTSGLMTAREFEEFEKVSTPHAKYWRPIQWLLSLVTLAWDEKRIKGEVIYVSLVDRIAVFRAKLINMFLFDWVPVPLVYTQVVHLTVYSYFVIALFSRQYLDRDPVKKSIDLYIPIMTMLQFTFFIGWVKVAEVLLNPLGEDDDDFESNWIIDRNLQVGFSVEECYDQYPPIDRDTFWSEKTPEPLYTAESALRPANPQVGSCARMFSPPEPSFMVRPQRATHSSCRSMWDGEAQPEYIVPVIGNNLSSSQQSLPHIVLPSESTHSFKTLVKKIRNGGRRLSAIAFRNRTPTHDGRRVEGSNDNLSNISSSDCASISVPFSSPARQTPPIYKGACPSKLQGLESGCCDETSEVMDQIRIHGKRHSAPDCSAPPPRHESFCSAEMLPVILEEKDKTPLPSVRSRRPSSDSTSAVSDATVRGIDAVKNDMEDASSSPSKSLSVRRTSD
uniref:Bestrophin homolog n=1 Tax=Haemonchus contortus TaxID=6289 RepID=A0A7I5E7M9_HAECO